MGGGRALESFSFSLFLALSLSLFLAFYLVFLLSHLLSLARSLSLTRSCFAFPSLTRPLLLSLLEAVFNEDGIPARNSSSTWCLHVKTASLAPANFMVPKLRIEQRPLLKVGMHAPPPRLRLREGPERDYTCTLAT